MAKKKGKDVSLWEMSSKPLGGRPRRFETAEELLKGALEYFRFVDEHPWQKKSANQSMSETDSGTRSNGARQSVIAIQRAYTLYGLCAFLGCYKWGDLRRNYAEREGFVEVMDWIENQVAAQQLDGAILRQFDGSIVARLNGLADTTINQVKLDDNIPKLDEDDLETLRRINGLK